MVNTCVQLDYSRIFQLKKDNKKVALFYSTVKGAEIHLFLTVIMAPFAESGFLRGNAWVNIPICGACPIINTNIKFCQV